MVKLVFVFYGRKQRFGLMSAFSRAKEEAISRMQAGDILQSAAIEPGVTLDGSPSFEATGGYCS
jgi:hypothetical protein